MNRTRCADSVSLARPGPSLAFRQVRQLIEIARIRRTGAAEEARTSTRKMLAEKVRAFRNLAVNGSDHRFFSDCRTGVIAAPDRPCSGRNNHERSHLVVRPASCAAPSQPPLTRRQQSVSHGAPEQGTAGVCSDFRAHGGETPPPRGKVQVRFRSCKEGARTPKRPACRDAAPALQNGEFRREDHCLRSTTNATSA